MRTGVLILCIAPTKALEALATPLCPYHDVYLCCDQDHHRERAPQADKPGIVCVPKKVAEAAGFLGSISWLPRRASSRCKALFWLAHLQADSTITHWWVLEEDVFVTTEATLLAIDAAHPTADLLSAHHHIKHSLAFPDTRHWSGTRVWPHWKLADGLVEPPLASSMVCAVRISKELIRRIGIFAAQHRRLLFCEMLFNTLALKNQLTVAIPLQLRGIVWREPRFRAEYPYMPDCLYHPIKSTVVQRKARQMGFSKQSWKEFTESWVGPTSDLAVQLLSRWTEPDQEKPERVPQVAPPSPPAAPAPPSPVLIMPPLSTDRSIHRTAPPTANNPLPQDNLAPKGPRAPSYGTAKKRVSAPRTERPTAVEVARSRLDYARTLALKHGRRPVLCPGSNRWK
jgi:hypothetical protein